MTDAVELNVDIPKQDPTQVEITINTVKHNELQNRELENQHPIQAINGLRDELDNKQEKLIAGDNITIINNVITSSGSSSGGVSSYNDLTDKPSLNFESANVNIQSHISSTSNPHSVTKSQVGLGSVDNTSDANKPVSTAQQTALDLKVDKVTGKSLISDSEITRLASVSNVDISGKVDKVTGKGLSTEDYTTTEKSKLSGIATGATAYTDAMAVSANSSALGNKADKTTTINSKPLSSNITLTTADIAPSTDKNYVTNAQQTVIGNTSGTNTGDETTSTIKTKLGITTLSGSNTGDQDLSTLTNTSLSNLLSAGKTLIANLSKPSTTFVSMTLPATANSIQAPYDGYMVVNKLSTAIGQHLGLGYRDIGYTTQTQYSVVAVQYLTCLLPCSAGQWIYCDYGAGGATNAFGCIRAKGTL